MELLMATLYAAVGGGTLSLATGYGLRALGYSRDLDRVGMMALAVTVAIVSGASRLGTDTHHDGLALGAGMLLSFAAASLIRQRSA